MQIRSLVWILTLAWLATARLAAQQLDNGIRAVVNDKVITQYQVEMNAAPAVDLIRRQYATRPPLMRQKIYEAYTNSLRQLIDREMIVHDFESSGFKLPEPIVNDYLQSRIKEQFGDRTELIKNLKNEGKSFEKFKEEARERIIVGALEAKNVANVSIVSPLKLERYYNERKEDFKEPEKVKLRMIVLDTTSAPTPEARKKLGEEIRTQILSGTNDTVSARFAQVATIYSTGSQRAQGGDWGWVERTVLRTNLSVVAFSLGTNQVSEVVETPDASYLMLVEETKPAGYKSIQDIRDELIKSLLIEERKRLQGRYVKKLEDKTFVRTY